MRGKHYDAITIDDMIPSPDNVRHAIEWYNSAGIDFGKEMLNDSNYNKGKGGNEMLKCVYHVILFNTATEEIDFKGYVPAKDEEAALMAAAQTFGKYDADVHVHNVKSIMQYEKK